MTFSNSILHKMLVKVLIVILIVFYSSISYSLNEPSNEEMVIIKNFNNYSDAYRELEKKCKLVVPKGFKMIIDIENCVWRKDQILLKEYKLYNILYEIAYQRYDALFKLSKTISMKINQDKRNAVNFMLERHHASNDILKDTFGLTRYKLVEYLEKNK